MQYAMQLPNDDDGKTQNRITELHTTTINLNFHFLSFDHVWWPNETDSFSWTFFLAFLVDWGIDLCMHLTLFKNSHIFVKCSIKNSHTN